MKMKFKKKKGRVYVNWKQIDVLVDVLADKIQKSGYEFEAIFGVPRGGLIPAVMLSHKTGIRLTGFPSRDTLIVDELTDTGKTMTSFGKEFKAFAVLMHNEELPMRPEFYAIAKPKGWIVFPWEVDK